VTLLGRESVSHYFLSQPNSRKDQRIFIGLPSCFA
jgi:hypothetical protein